MDSILGTVTDKLDKFLPGAKQQVKQFADKAKAYMNNMTELEIKVMEATNHEPWGPHGTAMQEITNAAFTSDGLTQIMGVLDMRMAEVGDNWRLVYKSLLLLEYMVKHGPARIADALLSNRLHRLEMLKEGFEYKEPSGRDQGINVRQRAGALVALISDRERLAEERERAAKNSGKFGGVSSSQSRYGGFAGGAAAGGGGGYSSGGFDSARQGAGGGAYGSQASIGRQQAGAGARDKEELDSIEATRQRIARLKAEGALPDSPGDGAGGAGGGAGDGFGAFEGAGGGGGGGGGVLDSPVAAARAPKKLSQVKVNPAISATLAKSGLLAPPAAASAGGAGAAAARAGGDGGSCGGAAGIDLLGDLMGDGPAPAAPAAASSGGGDWGAFDAAPAVAAPAATRAPSDGWAAFEAAPAAQQQQQQQQPQQQQQQQQRRGPIDLDSLLGVPAPSASAVGALPANAFADFSSATPSSSAAAPPPAAAPGDPFAASFAASHAAGPGAKSAAAAGVGAAKPKLGPETARAKDPFADLGAF